MTKIKNKTFLAQNRYSYPEDRSFVQKHVKIIKLRNKTHILKKIHIFKKYKKIIGSQIFTKITSIPLR